MDRPYPNSHHQPSTDDLYSHNRSCAQRKDKEKLWKCLQASLEGWHLLWSLRHRIVIYGLWIKLQHVEYIISSIHGKVGLIIFLVVILQLITSLVLKNRAWYRSLHKVMGYALAPILIIDAGWGLHNG